jgi:signal transduction histidine kinase/ligand-binding sensor domain-containing protein
MKAGLALITISILTFLLWPAPALALDPSLEISQYARTTWRGRNGFSLGNVFAMAQTPDGYLWFGTEFGLVRFDGIRKILWQPPAGQHLPDKGAYSLLVTRDGTLWIGTFAGLATWDGAKLTRYPELDGWFLTSMLEDREGTVWAGLLGSTAETPTGQLCAIRSGHAQCYLNEGAFGSFVWGLSEDRSGALWAGAESGLWRWKPGAPKRYPMPHMRISDLTTRDDGRLLIAVNGAGLQQFTGGRVETYPIRDAIYSKKVFRDHDVDSNKLLRDRNGGLWIGTVQRGLIHVHDGRADIFRESDGLSGDIVMSLFEDREGNIWVATTGGIDRFKELPVTTISARQGLSSDVAVAVVASADGSIWIATQDGLTRWKDGKATIFRKADGLPDDSVQSLFQDDQAKIWAFTSRGLAYFRDDRFIAVSGVPSAEVYSITGDKAGNLWLSGNRGLSHLRDGQLVEHFPWSVLGRQQQAKVIVFDPERGGIWLSFWNDGGVEYFKDGQVRASYTAADGLGKGHVPGLRLDRDGALWAATEDGGLSRIKDGHIATMTTSNGLPCDTIHWSVEDDDRSLWLYTACGLVRIARTELDVWIADPTHRIDTTLFDAADGVMLHSVAPSSFGPPFAKSTDGKLWLLIAQGVEAVDPRHLVFNKLPPPVHIEQIIADHKTYWQNLPDATLSSVRLPARTRDLQIGYTALSLTSPEKVHFKYKLEGQDVDWREVINDREVQYSNLAPGTYRFRVIASNNSGVWNEQGDTLEFSVDPAYYQTNWFRALCAVAVLTLLWGLYQVRVRQLHHEFDVRMEARVGERTRIARELHDTLLQSFHGLLFRFQAARNMLPNRPQEATQELDTALTRAEQALDEGRRSIQELRPRQTAEIALDQVLSTTGQELATSHRNGEGSPRFEVILEGERRALVPLVQDEIIRMARELLRNAFQHARAQRIEAEIRYGTDVFRLIVRDDGKGIDPQILKDGGRAGHWGMTGVHERARGIGATLEFWSEAGAGTEVRLTLPALVAYDKPRNGARFGPFRRWRIHEHQS